VDGDDLVARAVLDSWLSRRPVLLGEGDEVPVTDAVVDVGQLRLAAAEFAVLSPEVLSAGVETVDLLI
jgi:hypothetical protein